MLDRLVPETGAIYLMDRAYLDIVRLYQLHCAGAFFVMRAKKNLRTQRRYAHRVQDHAVVACAQAVILARDVARARHPTVLRRIRLSEPNTRESLVFLTTPFAQPA